MKWLIFCAMILGTRLTLANEVQEHTIYTTDQTCAIHYLSEKQKKLWTISVDQNYCQKGWVQGFTTVTLKDALNRDVRKLNGFFHNGYWLSDFPGQITEFFRYAHHATHQDFILNNHVDDSAHTSFYTIAQSDKSQEEYSAFNLCPKESIVLAVHTPVTDFEQSIFQMDLIKKAQKIIHQQCPKTTKFHIIGGTNQILLEEDGPFHATIDTKTEETTLSYTPPPSLTNKPQPTELRHESGEHLLTIQPTIPQEQPVTTTNDSDLKTTTDQMQDIIANSDKIQSAVDLALMAQVLQTPIQGKTILYINNKNMSQTPTATRPLPLQLQSPHPLNSGWYVVSGVFTPEADKLRVNLLWEKQCQKEWCADEN